MKFYVHCERPELTMVIVWDRNGTIQDVVDMFLENMKKKFPNVNNGRSKLVCYVHNSKGKELDCSASVAKVVKHMDDLHVRIDDDDEKDLACEMEQAKINLTAEPADELNEKKNAAIINVGNERYRKAIEIYKEILKIESKNRSAIIGLATCYRRSGRHKEFLRWAKMGLNIFRDDIEFFMMTGEGYVLCGNGDEAIETLMKCSKLARNSGGLTSEKRQEIQVLLAKAYLLKDEKDMAITLLQGVIRDNSDHDEALIHYADLLFPLGPEHHEEAMSILVTVLAKNKNHSIAKSKFAAICRQEIGMKALQEVIAPIITDSSALVFLANCLRDYGVIKQCMQMLEMSLKCSPRDPCIILLYIHTLELTCNFSEILQLYKNFIQTFSEARIGTFACSMLEPIVMCISTDMSALNNEPKCMETDTSIQPPDRDLTDDEKYILAILFTLVKVLYIRGLLKCIPPVIELLQPLYDGRQLHLSNIRNEAAYFNCVSELFKTYTVVPSVQLSPGDKYLYFIGDSHCIPPAWQKISVSGSQYIIHPILVTGLKIWHLRADSCFYPKTNFYNAIQSIPDNSNVVICLGEIDCREALLKCWEKARYDTIEDGMDALIKIYLQVMKRLQGKHQWKIFFHPVLPVLDITRPIVLQFNRILATKLLTEPSFHWLNFVKALLLEGEEMLKEEFRFDGTHVHPKYVTLFSEALSEFI